MTEPIERSDSALRAWLEQGPDRGRPEAVERALAATRRVPQRPGWSFPERWLSVNSMPAFPKVSAAVVALAVVGLGLAALRIIPGPADRPSPSPSPTVEPTTLASFTSDLNAYSFQLPDGWRAVPATEVWPEGAVFDDGDAKFMDVFVSSAGFGPMYFGSQPLTGDPTVWIRDQQDLDHSNVWPRLPTCPAAAFNTEFEVDGAGGVFDSSCKDNGLRAYVRTSERGYVFLVRGPAPEQWFRDVLATVQLGDDR